MLPQNPRWTCSSLHRLLIDLLRPSSMPDMLINDRKVHMPLKTKRIWWLKYCDQHHEYTCLIGGTILYNYAMTSRYFATYKSQKSQIKSHLLTYYTLAGKFLWLTWEACLYLLWTYCKVSLRDDWLVVYTISVANVYFWVMTSTNAYLSFPRILGDLIGWLPCQHKIRKTIHWTRESPDLLVCHTNI